MIIHTLAVDHFLTLPPEEREIGLKKMKKDDCICLLLELAKKLDAIKSTQERSVELEEELKRLQRTVETLNELRDVDLRATSLLIRLAEDGFNIEFSGM